MICKLIYSYIFIYDVVNYVNCLWGRRGAELDEFCLLWVSGGGGGNLLFWFDDSL